MEWRKLQGYLTDAVEILPPTFRATALLRAFGLRHVPLLLSVRPTVVELSDERIALRIPLNRWSRNHLGSMYFGALAMGADAAVGLLTMHLCRRRGQAKAHFSFKDFHADFLRRPEGDVLFICDEGARLGELADAVRESAERHNLSVPAYAVLETDPSQVVARFSLTVSLKRGKA